METDFSHRRFLTKSRFKLAMECPTKLFYTKKPEYADRSLSDPFLAALAEGGFQVSELAKCLYPGGTEIESRDYGEALRQTNALLRAENAVIYEAAVNFENFFILIDVLVKRGSRLDLIEVKSKSYDPEKEPFLNKNGTIAKDWQPYFYDVAFQKYVLASAFPDHSVAAFLTLADKRVACPTDGLNQKFRVRTNAEGRKHAVIATPVTKEDLTPPILCAINVDEYCEMLYHTANGEDEAGRSFIERAKYYSEYYERDEKIISPPHTGCRECEFRADDDDLAAGKLCGFSECWKENLGWTDADLDEPTVLEIWNYHHTKKKKRFEEGRLKMSEITKGDIAPTPDDKPGISTSERQWMQVLKTKNGDKRYWIDRENLEREMRGWKFPLHFIDFETSMAAIPFNRGRRPYEGIAFQFSHHLVDENGRVAHVGEYLNAEPGQFPNYDFLRALRRELSSDFGSIFRYADHENNYLNMIYRQLLDDPQVKDREELLSFIRSISTSSKSSAEKWEGERTMIDMLRLVKRYYYDPHTGGSNSIKQVLPAIMHSSGYLREKYSAPIYGATDGIPSLNFKDWIWYQAEGETVIDPYKLLPKMFADVSDDDFELISDSSVLNDGGAAMTAYARLQYEDMSDYERSEIKSSLLKYCELDTFAMVMIYEAWREMINN